MKLQVSLIAAIGKNREIGYQNKLLWSIKEDMRWFQTHTNKKVIIMGRNTYESIGKPLKNRVNVVLTRDKEYKPHPNVFVRHSIEEVIHEFRDEIEVMVIGGEQVYRQFFPYATRLYLTEVNKTFKADTFFPEFNPDFWTKYFSQKGEEDAGFDYYFNVYKKMLK